jgi:protein-tyrosine phosphatase
MGISRSATLVIAYLIKKNLIGAREALKYVEERRAIVFPNNGFLK